MDENQNGSSNPVEDIAKAGGKQVGKVAKRLGNEAQNAVKKVAKKVVKKAAQVLAKVLVKAIKSLLAAIGPYLGIAVALLLIVVVGWYLLVETRGATQTYSYSPQADNPLEYNDGGYFQASSLSGVNKAILEFYRYFGQNAYYQITGNDNTKLEKPDGTIQDYYNQEKTYSINPNFLFTLDEYGFQNVFRYPEQFVKPVYYDPETLTLKQLTNDTGAINVDSYDYTNDGKKTSKKVRSVSDYGVGSIFKYKQAQVTRTVEGFYTAEEVYNPTTKQVETVPIHEPFKEVMHDYPKNIWLIDKAVTFALDVKLAYVDKKDKIEDLAEGKTNDPAMNLNKVYYKTEDIYEDQVKAVAMPDGTVAQMPVKVKVGSVDLYKYREGGVYETKPEPDPANNIENKYGTRYIYDYLTYFESWVPKSVQADFDFNDRTGQLVDSNFDIGSEKDSATMRKALQYQDLVTKYANMYGVDPDIILAMICQESGGNPDIEDGLMQITGDGYRSVSAHNYLSGTEDTFAVTNEDDRRNPDKAIHWGVMYFANKYKSFGNDVLKTIQSYNFDVSGYMTQYHPDAWDSLDWLNYREDARLYLAKQEQGWLESRSSSYTCAPQWQKDDSLPVWGDSCYIENVIRYYMGDSLAGIDLHDAGTNPNHNYSEDEPHFKFVHHMGDGEIDMVLKMTKAFDQKILYSDVGESDTLDFWDDDFSTTNVSLTADQFIKMVPGADGYISPLNMDNPVITSGFGTRIDPVTHEPGAFHKGVDVGVPIGTPVYAIANGTVEKAVNDQGNSNVSYGNYVKVRLGDGNAELIGHMSQVIVKEGDSVVQGQLLGYSGNSGKSTGPHMHFEFYLGDKAIDGEYIITRDYSSSPSAVTDGAVGD